MFDNEIGDARAILLMHAYVSGALNLDETDEIADALRLPRSELTALASDTPERCRYMRIAERRSPRSAAPLAAGELELALAIAYAHGRIEYEDLVDWAREANLDDRNTLDAIAYAAALAYGDKSGVPLVLRNPGQTTPGLLGSAPSETPR